MKFNNIEREKLNFEKEKFNMECKLREREITLKEKEFKRSKITPIQVALLVAMFGILGTAIGGWIHGHSDEKLERLKFESDVILKAATSDSHEKNKRNLKFLLDVGFINDQQGSIRKLVNEKDFDFKIESPNEQKFQFQNAPMRSVIRALEKRFDVSFLYRAPSISFTVSGHFYMNDDLTNILRKIEQHAPVKFMLYGQIIAIVPSEKFNAD